MSPTCSTEVKCFQKQQHFRYRGNANCSWNILRPCTMTTPGRRQSKTPILSRNVDQKSLEAEFSIGICRHTGDKWQSKTLLLTIFDLRLSIVDSVFHCHLPDVVTCIYTDIICFENREDSEKPAFRIHVAMSEINKTLERKIENVFLSIKSNICCGCTKEPSH